MKSTLNPLWFRKPRTYKAAQKVYAALAKLGDYFAREYSNAVQATKLELAHNLLMWAGKTDSAEALFTELRIAREEADKGIHIPTRRKRTRSTQGDEETVKEPRTRKVGNGRRKRRGRPAAVAA